MYNQTGTLVREQRLSYGITEMTVGDLPEGMYIWHVESHLEILRSGKIIKLKK